MKREAKFLPSTLSGLIMLLAVTATTLNLACERPGNVEAVNEGQRAVADDLGRTVNLPAKVDRVVSLAPSVTELIFAAGAGDKLVGDTTFCDYPLEAQRVAKVGDTQTPNIEAIVAVKPQVVFVTTASQLESFTKTLEEQGIAVFVTRTKDVDDVARNLRQFGELLGTKEQAEKVAESLERRIAARREADRSQRHPGVFLQISNEPLFTIGKDSFLNQVIKYAGGESVTRDIATAFPKLSKETALALNPEVIILSDSEDNEEPNAVFKNSPAVKNGRVYRINADIISRPGPRLVDAMEQIARCLGNDVASAE